MKGWIIFFRNRSELREEDYSLKRILQAAEKEGIEMEVYSPSQFDLIVNRADRRSILIDGVPKELPDFVMCRMGAQTSYFALAILRQLEQLGVGIINPASTIERVSDKLFISQVLAQSELPTPKTMLAKHQVSAEVVKREIGFPCVIKIPSGTAGRGVYLSNDASSFRDVMDLIYENNPNANIIVQEFIQASKGKDLRVFVVGGRVIGCMQRTSVEGFKANVSLGGSVEKYPLTKEMEWLALETCRLLHLDIAGVDLLFTGTGYTICEANSSPGFIGLEKAIGQIVAEEICSYIKVRFQGG